MARPISATIFGRQWFGSRRASLSLKLNGSRHVAHLSRKDHDQAGGEHIRMQSQLIPPPELAPPSVKHLPLAKRIELWEDSVNENEVFLRAGLRAKLGRDSDLDAAYRQWYARRMDEHDRMQAALAANLSRREAGNGR
jgi:hypothetical protein